MVLRRVVTMTSLGGAQAVFNAGSALVTTIALGPAGRGVMVVAVTVASLVGFIGGLGTGVALRSRYPSATGEDRSSLVAAYTWWTTVGALGTPMVTVAALAASAGLIDSRLADPSLLVAAAIYTSSQVVLFQLMEGWYAGGHFVRATTSGAAITAAGFLLVLACLEVKRSPAAFLLAQGSGMLAVGLVVALQLSGAGLLRFSRVLRRDLTSMLRLGAPVVGYSTGLSVVMRADRYVLGIVVGPVAVGIYSLAATIGEFARLLPLATGELALREVSLGRGAEETKRLVRVAVLVTAAGGLLAGILGWFLIPRIFGTEFADARGLLVILLIAEVFFAPYAVASRGLLGGGWTTTAGLLGVIGGAGAVACYWVFTALAGSIGAAVASLLVYAALSAAAWRLLLRKSRTRRSGPDQAPITAAAEGHRA